MTDVIKATVAGLRGPGGANGTNGTMAPSTNAQIDAATDNATSITPLGLAYALKKYLAPNFLFDSFHQLTAANMTLGGFAWYNMVGSYTWTSGLDADFKIRTPIANLASGAQYRHRFPWPSRGVAAGSQIVVSIWLLSTVAKTGGVIVNFYDSTGAQIGTNISANIANTGNQFVLVPLTVPTGDIAYMQVVAGNGSTMKVAGVFASTGTVPPAPVEGPTDPVFLRSWIKASGFAYNLPAVQKALIGTWTAQTGLTVTTGKYIKPSDGTEVAGASYSYVTVPMTGLEPALRVTAPLAGTSTALVVYKDAAGTVVGSEQPGGGAAPVTYSIVLSSPDTAVVAYVSYRNDAGTATIETGAFATTLPARVSSLELSINALKKWYSPAQTVVASTRYDLSTGAAISDSNYNGMVIDLTALPADRRIRINSYWVASGIRPAVYVDASNNVLGYEPATYPGSAQTLTNVELTAIPTTATKVLLSSRAPTMPAWQLYGVNDSASSKWAGKIMACLGDSITANFNWPPLVQAILGLGRVDNNGIGGTRIAYRSDLSDQTQCMCDDARINAVATDIDVLTVMGGTNDHGQNVPLGAITGKTVRSGFDATTFYGACEQMAVKLLTRYPTQRIIWLGQTYVDRGVTIPSGWPNSLTNTLGLTQWDYIAATKAVADKYGIPFVNMLDECGWSTTNISNFTNAEGGTATYIHPNQTGANRMAGVLVGGMNAVQPIS